MQAWDEQVFVIGATNRPDAIDAALRRAGRFDREVAIGIPDERSRCSILHVLTNKMRLSGDFDFNAMARRTPGFVGADLASLCKEAASIAVNRVFHQLATSTSSPSPSSSSCSRRVVSEFLRSLDRSLSAEELAPLCISEGDFALALTRVQPSSKREGFASVPSEGWEAVGALDALKEELRLSLVLPIRRPELFASVSLSAAAGVLLFGPPGCGKTLLARAVANESGASFLAVKGPELLNKFVGESERAVRVVFERARASAPAVVFFDEIDALAPRRGSKSDSVSERVVNQLLTELDGLDARKQVLSSIYVLFSRRSCRLGRRCL